MNIILAESDEITNQFINLTDYRAEHVVKVLRSEVGDVVRVGIIDGGKGTGEILAINKKYPFSVDLCVEISGLEKEVPPLDLILALPRPIMLKRILSQVTALGVGSIHLIQANRVEKSFWESSIVAKKEFKPFMVQGLEQAVETLLPKIYLHTRFRPFVEDYYPAIRDGYHHHLLAHPGGQATLQYEIDGKLGRAVFAIGPEGGWVDYEVQKFREQGFVVCSIGERILKVDTAVVALHARISLLME
jgi:16S rRNA (uracil1498-N3)-methyltransferase